MTDNTLPIVAIAISICAAGFTGWQAWVAHRERSDRKRARLRIVGSPLNKRDPEGSRWRVENYGDGPAIDIELSVVFQSPAEVVPVTFTGRVVGVLAGNSSQPVLEEGLRWPGGENFYRDHPTTRVWEGAVVQGSWARASGRRTRTKTMAVSLPSPS